MPIASETESGTAPELVNDDRITLLAVLSTAHYIDDDRCDAARERLLAHPEIQFEPCTSRQLLNWLIAEKYIDRDGEENATLKILQWSEDKTVALDQRIAMLIYLNDVDSRISARLAALLELRKKKAKNALLMQVGGVLAVLIGFGIYKLIPDSTPQCSASSATSALDSLLLESAAKGLGGQQMVEQHEFPRTRNYREIGYDSKDHSRGCIADLSLDKDLVPGKEKMQIGYVVLRTPEDKNRFAIQAFPPEYVMARYNAATLNNTLGTPVGRDNMETAVKAALVQLDAQTHAPSMPSTNDDQPEGLANSVLSVIPSANCRALPDGRQSCPVTVDYRDNLLSAIGAVPIIQLHSEFVFVKNGTGWTVSDDFPKTFLSAIVTGRMSALSAKPPGAASEASN
jgi:hypothetical protein